MSALAVGFNVVALLLGAATLVAGFARPQLWRGVNLGAWIVTVAGFAALQFAEAGLGVVTATAAAAGLATLRCSTEDDSRCRRVLGFGAAVPIALAAVGILSVRDAATPWGNQIVIYTAAWAALAAGVSSLVAAAGLARRPVGSGVAIAVVGATIGVIIAGTGRSSLAQAFYGFPLRTEEGPLHWVVPPIPGFEEGLRLAVAAPLPSMLWLLAAVAVAALVAGVVSWTRLHRVASAGWAGCGAAAVGLLASIQPTIAGVSMPDSAIYVEHVKRLLLVRNMGDRGITTGALSSDGAVFVGTADLAPELFAMIFVVMVALVATYLTFRPSDEAADEFDPSFGRDHAARGLGFAWLAWFVGAIVHHALYGSPGVGGPGEWALLGVLVGATGLVLLSWHRENQLLRIFSELTAGLVVAAIFVVVGFAWRFGALPVFSIGVL